MPQNYTLDCTLVVLTQKIVINGIFACPNFAYSIFRRPMIIYHLNRDHLWAIFNNLSCPTNVNRVDEKYCSLFWFFFLFNSIWHEDTCLNEKMIDSKIFYLPLYFIVHPLYSSLTLHMAAWQHDFVTLYCNMTPSQSIKGAAGFLFPDQVILFY